jgi:hypothetical protein
MPLLLRRALTLLSAAAALVGCRETVTSADDLAAPARDTSPVQTDSLRYQLVRGPGEYRAFVYATYRNTTGAPVHFQRCSQRDTLPMFSLGRAGPDSARAFFTDWAWACVGGVPTGTLLPGRAVTVRVPVGSSDQPNMQPPLRPEDLVGIFRIRLALCAAPSADSDDCVSLPSSQQRSNAFLVHY